MNYNSINPYTSPGEGVTVFTSPYLSAGAPAQGEAKGLIFCRLYYQKDSSKIQYIYSDRIYYILI